MSISRNSLSLFCDCSKCSWLVPPPWGGVGKWCRERENVESNYISLCRPVAACLHPWVVEGLLSCPTFLAVHLQQILDQILNTNMKSSFHTFLQSTNSSAGMTNLALPLHCWKAGSTHLHHCSIDLSKSSQTRIVVPGDQ